MTFVIACTALALAVSLTIQAFWMRSEIDRWKGLFERAVAGSREDHKIMESIIRRQNTMEYEAKVAPYFREPPR